MYKKSKVELTFSSFHYTDFTVPDGFGVRYLYTEEIL